MEKILNKLAEGGIDLAFKLLAFIIILVVGFKIVKVILKLIKRGKGFHKLEKSVQTFILSFISISLKCLVFIVGLSYLGIPMSSLVTLLGTASLAVGLAMQGGLTNMVGGLLILIFKPFQVGDWIEFESVSGSVEEIGVFYTVLKTLDCTKVVLPNGNLANSNIKNYSANEKRKLCIDFPVNYNSDIDKVKKVLSDVINEEELILKDEEVFIELTSYEDSALIFTIRVWTKNENFWATKFKLLDKVKKAFDKNKIEIPYSQLDVHLDK